MAADVGIKITAIDATKDAFNSANQSLASLKSAATSVQGALASIGAGLSVGAFVGWVKNTLDAADAMNDMSQRVGIAVQDLAKYELATKQSGTTMEALAKGIKGLSMNLAEHGGALSKIGINAKSSDAAMQQLADIFASMPDGIEKTTLAVQVFGKAGMDMIPMLNLGSKGLQEAADKSAKYAAQMALMAPMADAFNDNMAELAMTSKIMGMSMVNDALPGLVSISAAMADASVKGGTFQGILAGISAGFENYKKNVREFWGGAAPNTGGASGSWGEPAASTAKPDDWLEKYKALMAAMGGNTDAQRAMADTNRELEAQAKLVAELSGLTGSFAQDWGRLTAMYARGALSMAQLTAAQASLLKKQPAMQAADKVRLDLAKENTKAVDELIDAEEKLRLNNEDQIKTSRTMLEQLEFETKLLDLNAEQRAIATMERDLETKGIVKGTQAYEAYIEKLREAMAIKSGKEAGINAAKEMADAQKKAAEESGKYWEDALMRAFESGKGFFQSLWDTIKNTLKTQVLKIGIQGVMSGLGIGASGAAMAGQSAFGSAASSMIGSSISSLIPASFATFGNSALASIQSMVGMTGTVAQASTAAANGLAYGATGAGSMAASIGAAMPYIGAAVLAYSLLTGNNTKSTSGTGQATQTFDATGKLIGTVAKEEWGGLSPRAAEAITGMQSVYTAQAVALGIKVASTSFSFGSNTGKQGEGNNFAVGGAAGSSTYSSAGEIAYSPEAMQLEASRAVFAALKGSELPKYLQGAFDGLNAATATSDQINATLTQAAAVKSFHEAMQALPWDNVKNMTYGTTIALANASGGLDALQNSLASMSASSMAAKANIAALVSGIDTSVGKSIYDMQYGMADTRGKYGMLDVSAKNYDEQMRTATDIAGIAQAAQAQIDTINKAWSLLDATQQQATYSQFESRLEAIDTFVQSKGADAMGLQAAADQKTADTIAAAVEAAVAKAMASSATAMQAAADKADKPVEVNVNVTAPAGSEVSIG